MVYKKYTPRKNARASYLKRKYLRRAPMYKKPQTVKHRFSEMVQVSPILLHQNNSAALSEGQILSINMGSIPQFSSYKALYRKYKINKITWYIMPDFGPSESNALQLNHFGGVGQSPNSRMAVSWLSSSYVNTTNPLPAGELDVLSDNGSRVLSLNGKPFKLTVNYPIALNVNILSVKNATTSSIAYSKNQYFGFDDSALPELGGIRLWTRCDAAANSGEPFDTGTILANVYCKVHFTVADPR